MSDFIKFAAKGKLHKNKRLLNCFILVTLITIPLICAVAFSESMMNGITEKLIYLTGGHITAEGEVPFSKIEKFVDESLEVINCNVLLFSKDEYCATTVKGVEPEYFNTRRKHYLNTESGLENNNGLLISSETAETLNLSVGDPLALIVVGNDGRSFNPLVCIVDGIYDSGYKEIDNLFSYCQFGFAKEYFNTHITTELILKDEFKDNIETFIPAIKDYSYTTWINRNSTVYTNFINSRQMIMIVLAVIIIMTSFYIASVSNEFIQDDMEELSTYRLLGADKRSIFRMCFRSVFSVVSSGITAGTILGCAVSLSFTPILKYLNSKSFEVFSYYLLDFKVVIPYLKAGCLILFMFSVSAITIILSLRKAGKVTPLQLFNYKW